MSLQLEVWNIGTTKTFITEQIPCRCYMYDSNYHIQGFLLG